MEIIKIDLKNITKEDIEKIANAFLVGKTIAYPTDTVYGLGCLAINEKAVEKIYRIKKRKKTFPFVILLKSFCMAKEYAKINAKQDAYLRSIWPSRKSSQKILDNAQKNPKTVILDSRGLLPRNVTASDNSLALRLPKNDFLSTILTRVNLPIISTSLNISGQKPVSNPRLVEKYFKNIKPDLLIDAGVLPLKEPSSIIDIRDINNIIKIR